MERKRGREEGRQNRFINKTVNKQITHLSESRRTRAANPMKGGADGGANEGGLRV